ncbi:MAG: LamG-like jellyroll fold domain-containing protein [Flavobacteriales bacterium]
MDLRYTAALGLLPFTLSTAQPTPQFHWLLNETSGTSASELYGSTPGLLQGGASWAPGAGHHGGACRFDGVDDRIILGPCDMTTGTGEFSFSVWVKPDFVTAMDRTILAKTVGPSPQDHIWSMTFVSASALRFRLRTGASTTTLSTPPSSVFSGIWYHVVGAYDGAHMRIYLNGALMAETAASGSMGFHPQAPASVAALSTGAAPFSGWVDEIRLYDVGLTQQEVIDILLEEELTTAVAPTPSAPIGHERWAILQSNWARATLIDALGRPVGRPSFDPVSGVDLSGLAPGLYLVCLQEQGHRATWPIMVQ